MRNAHAILPILALVSGCGGAAAGQVVAPERPLSDLSPVIEQDVADASWARRAEVNQLRRAIEAWNDRVKHQPDDATTWIRLAEAHHFAATHPTTTDNDARLDAVEGHRAALRALSVLSPETADAVDAGRLPETLAPPDAVAAFYWFLRNGWRVAILDGYAAMLLAAPTYRAGLELCARLAPTLDRHGATVALAELYCAPVEPHLRDAARGRALFEQAITAEPDHLSHRVGLAQQCAVHAQDRELFQRSLDAVMGASVDDAQDNVVAQQRARQLLEHADDWFE